MAQVSPFFHHVAHVTGLMAPAPEPERYPFHDNDACPIGQEVKASGDWQYYDPHNREETRSRCATCVALSHQDGDIVA